MCDRPALARVPIAGCVCGRFDTSSLYAPYCPMTKAGTARSPGSPRTTARAARARARDVTRRHHARPTGWHRALEEPVSCRRTRDDARAGNDPVRELAFRVRTGSAAADEVARPGIASGGPSATIRTAPPARARGTPSHHEREEGWCRRRARASAPTTRNSPAPTRGRGWTSGHSAPCAPLGSSEEDNERESRAAQSTMDADTRAACVCENASTSRRGSTRSRFTTKLWESAARRAASAAERSAGSSRRRSWSTAESTISQRRGGGEIRAGIPCAGTQASSEESGDEQQEDPLLGPPETGA